MISVIVPTLNEADRLAYLIRILKAQSGTQEVIVVDGGSADGTPEIAKAEGAVVISAQRGRGHQLRAGAAQAKGDVLLFLHADSKFPEGGLAAIDDALMANPDVLGGNFQLTFDGNDRFSEWLDDFYAKNRRRGIYYGDSGVFVRRSAYDALGGIRKMELMEDFDFNRRLEKAGKTICIETPPLVTSSRRFRGRHPAGIVCEWLWIHALYYLKAPSALLARQYDSVRRRQAVSIKVPQEH